MTSQPFLIVGLGNPGSTYTRTRHNLGFLAIDALYHHYNAGDLFSGNSSSKTTSPRTINEKFKKKYHSEVWEISLPEQKVILAKPQTFVNNSGQAVLSMMSAYKLPLSQLLFLYDDVSLPFGKLKIKLSGSSGGHNGITSIITQIGKEFPRLKCGIGPTLPTEPSAKNQPPLERYVLNAFNKEEQADLPAYCKTIAQAAHALITTPSPKIMNHINGKHFKSIDLRLSLLS